MILYKFPFGPLETNALLIGCSQTKKGAVIDPAMGSTQALRAQAAKLDLKIEAIFLTHSHWDHFVDAKQLKEETQAPLYVHPLDQKNVEEPGSDGLPLFFPIQGAKVDFLFHEGQILKVGRLEMQVIHTPGHSPGGVCFYLPQEKLLIAGDTLFRGTMGTLSLPTAEPELMWKSLEKLSHLPPETRVVSGHGPDTTIQAEAWLKNAKEKFS